MKGSGYSDWLLDPVTEIAHEYLICLDKGDLERAKILREVKEKLTLDKLRKLKQNEL